MDRRMMLVGMVGLVAAGCDRGGASPTPSTPPRTWSGNMVLTDSWKVEKANRRNLEVAGDNVYDPVNKKERSLTEEEMRRLDEMLMALPQPATIKREFNKPTRAAIFEANDGTKVTRSTTDQSSELWTRIEELYDFLKPA